MMATCEARVGDLKGEIEFLRGVCEGFSKPPSELVKTKRALLGPLNANECGLERQLYRLTGVRCEVLNA